MHEFHREVLCIGTATAIAENDQAAPGMESHRHLVTSPRHALGVSRQETSGFRAAEKKIVHRRAVVEGNMLSHSRASSARVVAHGCPTVRR
ncbi:MAG TPA: hypothetical protein VGD72_09575 [Mycobacteriales bacterium]